MINWRYPYEYSPYRPFDQTMRLDKYLLMNRPDLDFTDDDAMLDAMYDLCFTGKGIELIDIKYRDAFVLLFAHEFLMRQLGLETVNLWKDRLNHSVRKNAVLINALFALAEDPKLYSMKYIRARDEGKGKTSAEQRNRNNVLSTATEANDTATSNTASNTASSGSEANADNRTGTNVNAGNTSSDGRNVNKFSDTPQGALTGLEDDEYLTNATIASGTSSGTSSGTGATSEDATHSGVSASEQSGETAGVTASDSKTSGTSVGAESEDTNSAETEVTNENETMLQLDYEKLIAYATHNFIDDILDLFRDLFILFE